MHDNSPRGSILLQTYALLNDPDPERRDQYGRPEDNFALIADLWSAYLGHTVTADQVPMMMALFKIARESTGVGKQDNVRDALGYLALYDDRQNRSSE